MGGNWKLGLGYTLLTALMWGVLPLALKAVMEVMDPVTISWYRFSMSAAIALAWYGHRSGPALRELLAAGHWRVSALACLGLVGNYLLYNWGLDLITPGAAQILIQLAPLLLLLASVVLFKERFSALQWLGVCGFCLGMTLFFHQRLGNLVPTDRDYLAGAVLIVAAAVIWSVYGVAQKQLLLKHHAKDILLLICLTGTLLLWPLSRPGQVTALNGTELALLLFCGLNTIIAYGSFGLALSHWQASRVSAVLPVTPLFTLLVTLLLNEWLGIGVAAEPLDWLGLLGALLVVAGSILAALSRGGGQQDNAQS